MHGFVLNDDEAHGHVAHDARDENHYVDGRQGDQHGQAYVFGAQDLKHFAKLNSFLFQLLPLLLLASSLRALLKWRMLIIA